MTRGTTGRPPLALTAKDGTAYELRGWLTTRLYGQLPGVELIEPGVQLVEYGLDSVAALGLYGEIEEAFGLRLEPGAVYEHATVDELALHLADRAAALGRHEVAGS
ncbi:hypothetical protein GCM10009760_45140 [Kitasatospora kazusensis]|uniref:Carrier domain-containing protein n=1 Tax=Kitasatospora kazusensis TaxID=407974 RepID=A0ABP5LN93_9ACTN